MGLGTAGLGLDLDLAVPGLDTSLCIVIRQIIVGDFKYAF